MTTHDKKGQEPAAFNPDLTFKFEFDTPLTPETIVATIAAAHREVEEAMARYRESEEWMSSIIRGGKSLGLSWAQLAEMTGLTVSALRVRAGGEDPKPLPTLEGHVGVVEAAKILGVSPNRVGHLSRTGEVPFTMVEGKRRYPVKDLEAFAKTRRTRRKFEITEPPKVG